MRKAVTLALLVAFLKVHAQVYDYNWLMCEPNLVMRWDSESFVIDSATIINRWNFLSNSSSTISDSIGILFFTHGAKVFDKNGNIMEDGDKMFLSNNDLQATFSDTSEGLGLLHNPVCLPFYNYPDSFLILHKSNNDTVPSHDVFLSVVDMKENNGLGKVVTTSQSMARRMSGSNIAACKHANGKDWWILGRLVNSNRYVKWLFDAEGNFVVNDTQTVGSVYLNPDFYMQNLFNLQGNNFVAGGSYGLSLFKFDRCSGNLLLVDSLITPFDTVFNGITGVQFSPNGRYLYVTRYNFLDQYDLHATNINAGFIRLVDLRIHNIYRRFQRMQTAPNSKIFIAGYGSPIPFSIINFPDSAGFACGLDTFILPFSNSLNTSGMPTYPHYRTPAAEAYQADAGNSREVCDSIINANGVTLGTPHVSGVKYAWSSPQNTNFNSTQAQVNVQPASTTTYILHIQDTANTYYSCTERWDTVTITVVQSCISGVEDYEGARVVRVFPNPATDVVTIETEEPGTLIITNSLGQTVFQSEIQPRSIGAKSAINCEVWSNGLYYYSFTFSQSKPQAYGKLVKQ